MACVACVRALAAVRTRRDECVQMHVINVARQTARHTTTRMIRLSYGRICGVCTLHYIVVLNRETTFAL